jgi:hypothetical protein
MPLRLQENLRRSRSVYSNDLESLRQDFIHWHTAALPIFRVCSSHGNDALDWHRVSDDMCSRFISPLIVLCPW